MLAHLVEPDKFLSHYIYCIGVRLLNSHTVAFRLYQTKILHSLHCNYFKGSMFKKMFRIELNFAFHFSFKTLEFLQTGLSWVHFSNKYLAILHWQFCWDNWNVRNHLIQSIERQCSTTVCLFHCRNILLVSFYKGKQSKILHSYFDNRHTLNTKKIKYLSLSF